MIFQPHWQNPADLDDTTFVGQSDEGMSAEQVQEWLRELCERRKDECPDGWMSLLCN